MEDSDNTPGKSAKTEDLQNLQVKNINNDNSGVSKEETEDIRDLKANNTDKKYIELNNTESINLSGGLSNSLSDGMDEIDEYRRIIKNNIEYDHHMKYDDIKGKELYNELYELICDMVCVKRK